MYLRNIKGMISINLMMMLLFLVCTSIWLCYIDWLSDHHWFISQDVLTRVMFVITPILIVVNLLIKLYLKVIKYLEDQ